MMISTRRFCGSRTPGPVGTSSFVSPKPWMLIEFRATPRVGLGESNEFITGLRQRGAAIPALGEGLASAEPDCAFPSTDPAEKQG